MVNNKAAMYRR
jgi:hypothetical protein